MDKPIIEGYELFEIHPEESGCLLAHMPTESLLITDCQNLGHAFVHRDPVTLQTSPPMAMSLAWYWDVSSDFHERHLVDEDGCRQAELKWVAVKVKDIEFFDTLKGALEDGIAHNKGEIELKTTEVKGETNEESLRLVCKHCKNMISIREHKQHQKICEKYYVNRELGVSGGIDPDRVPNGTHVFTWEDTDGDDSWVGPVKFVAYYQGYIGEFLVNDGGVLATPDRCRLADSVSIPDYWRLK